MSVRIISLFIFCCGVLNASAVEYEYWHNSTVGRPVFPDPKLGCDYIFLVFWAGTDFESRYGPEYNEYISDRIYGCALLKTDEITFSHLYTNFKLHTKTCSAGYDFDYETASCVELDEPLCNPPLEWDGTFCIKKCSTDKPWSDTARDCIAPAEPQSCSNQTGAPSNLAGNPINFLNGHKLQREPVFTVSGDFPLTFSWLYNSFGNLEKSGAGYTINFVYPGEAVTYSEAPVEESEYTFSLPLDGDSTSEYTGSATDNWRHNHSYFLAHYTLPDGETERVIAYRPDGSDLHFADEDGTFVGEANRDWIVTQELDESGELSGWKLKIGGRIETYDTVGRVLRVENQQGEGISYTYDDSGVYQSVIADDNGNSVDLTWNDGKLIQITRNDGSVYEFTYNDDGLLKTITFPGEENPQRTFRYEDDRFPNALTGVTDEAGKIYSTFTYDDQGRAIRTEHNGGAESVDVEYIDDYTRRTTNALGKQTTYNYTEIDGVKRITSVDGEASANCAAANKGYTYDANGFIASETDWEGNTTTYTRDNLGRELTRTDGSGTAESKVVVTEWHDSLNVPVKITTSEDVVEFSYDSKGRLQSKKVTPK
ncbi:hypothetical protein ACJJIF_08565 [Microbulbifer sp. SSSA002]|uniref:hypothetical protein n=1 Tax=Microbulbifer sp. SSSA002 TaxID=3243376 RepID=UPI004039ACDB